MPHGHHNNLRTSSRSGLNSLLMGEFQYPRRIVMSNAYEAPSATTEAAIATAGRLDAIEQNQIQMSAQLTGIAQHFQTLLGSSLIAVAVAMA